MSNPTHAIPNPRASDTARIRALNDALRKSADPNSAHVMDGQLVITRGIAARGSAFITRAFAAVRTFDDFTPDNDPFGEHDFAFLEIEDVRIFFKIDYFDATERYLTVNPGEPETTRRVLTIGLGQEY